MPFTPTHAVAIVPLWGLRHKLPFPALAIGAMVPDLGLFFPVAGYSTPHSLQGLFTHCLPIGVAIFLLFETTLRRPLIALLPANVQVRVETRPQLAVVDDSGSLLTFYTGVMIAVIVGAFTHLVWDSFTHQGRWGTKLIPALNTSFIVGGYAIPVFKLLQYGSTVFGLPLLVAFVMGAIHGSPVKDESAAAALVSGTKMTVAAGGILCIVAVYAVLSEDSWYRAVSTWIRISGAVLCYLIVAYSLFFQVQNRSCRQRQEFEQNR